MTIGSVAAATFFLLLLVVGGAAYGWANAVAVQRWYWLFIIVLLVLVFATVARPGLAPITGIVYSLGQGALVGSISKIYETFYEGMCSSLSRPRSRSLSAPCSSISSESST